MADEKKEVKSDYGKLISAFGEASRFSISFVFFPVVFLLIGVWLDKKFKTLPAFIIGGIILGIVVFVYQVRKAIKEISKNK